MRVQNIHRVGIYLRLSRDDGNSNAESMSIVTQKQMLTDYVKERGWDLTETYIDDGYSGTTFDRPAFQRMLKDIEHGYIDCVITKDLSRLGRNYAKTGYYTEEYFLEHGVRYIAVNDNVDTMKDDNDIAPFKNILNEMYAKDIPRKVRSARAVSARQGKFLGSKPPFGYTRCPTDKHKLIIDEKPAQIISRMFDMFASGDSGRHISDVFNNEGILSPRAYYYQQIGRENPLNESMTWNSNTVMQLLRNPVYIGNMVQGKRRVTSFKTKSRAVVPEDDWIVVENTHEAIIGKDSWAKVQKKIASGKSPRVTKSGEISLFAGIARCADCGASMTFNTKQYDGRTYYIYKCSRYAVHGKSTCSIHHIPASALEEAVLQNIRFNAQLLSENDEELLEKLIALGNRGQQCEMQEARTKLNEDVKRLEVVEDMAQKLFEERCTGNVPDSVFKKLMQNYDIEQANLNHVIAEKRNTLMEIENASVDISAWAEEFKQYTNIDKLNRKIVTKLIDSVEVHESTKENGVIKQHVTVNYKFVGQLSA